MWMTRDEQFRLIVVITPKPPEYSTLEMSGLKEGMLRGLPSGCRITSSSESTLNGVPLYVLSAKGTVEGQPLSAKQVLFPLGTNAYKLMAAGSGDVEADPVITGIFNSVTIAVPAPTPAAAAAPAPAAAVPAANRDPNYWSVKIAEFGWLALLGAGAVAVIFRATRRKKTPPPLPPSPPT
jgi:hypothetical protein